jgi:glycerol-3-phosphate acyltransferase PlsY
VLETIARIAAPLAVGYLVGGIPWALIVGKRFYGIDLREHGSGNLGATNVFRSLGFRAGLAVFALDIAKGAAAVALAMLLCPPEITGNARDWVLISVAMSAVLGHSFSPYIRFRGGKGVATAAGTIAVMMPMVWPILFVSFIVIVAIWRMVSLASIIMAIEFPILTWMLYPDRPALMTFAVVAATLVIIRHWSNIGRIARGEENKISLSRRGEAVSKTEED